MINKAVRLINEILKEDPKGEALIYSQQCFEWLQKLNPNFSESQEIAARCQHFRRWDIPRKDFPMDKKGYYQWRISPPENSSKSCVVHIESYALDTEDKTFDATLKLKRKPLNKEELNRVLIKTPIQTASIVFGIYWQALKLFLKRSPFYKHPAKPKI